MEMRLVPSQYLLIMISSVTGFCVLNKAFLKRPRVAIGFLIIYNGGELYIIRSIHSRSMGTHRILWPRRSQYHARRLYIEFFIALCLK